MESYKNYTMDKADLILHPVIGGELILLNYVGFAQESRFQFLRKIEARNGMNDTEILKFINFKQYLSNDVFIINEDSYIKDKVYLMDANHIDDFVGDYFELNASGFFGGDTFFISPLNKALIEFQHNGYVFLHQLPIVLNDYGKSKMLTQSINYI
ncbi:hypothetical protein [Xenorhabdus sp. IM139775]|uniref:hypothetical protein n=1 Tax=Xenorhabdus sp. IM139775 TaxID=3025876 RepID=UPI0023589A5C|nr:hypothetical protein [Xenorhabdus sp. IM139775]MDC9592460.1 hypothetical protein [Xenorhabdus sp. IM139775]